MLVEDGEIHSWSRGPSYPPRSSHSKLMNAEDFVTIELDCGLSQIVFKRSDTEIILYGPVQLPERECWYPAVKFGLPMAGTCEMITD